MINLYKATGETQVVMGTNGSTPLWVAEDGSWGTTPLTIFDAHNWTANDFDTLDEASNSTKVAVARGISHIRDNYRAGEIAGFLDKVRADAERLGIRLFMLTEEGMDEV